MSQSPCPSKIPSYQFQGTSARKDTPRVPPDWCWLVIWEQTVTTSNTDAACCMHTNAHHANALTHESTRPPPQRRGCPSPPMARFQSVEVPPPPPVPGMRFVEMVLENLGLTDSLASDSPILDPVLVQLPVERSCIIKQKVGMAEERTGAAKTSVASKKRTIGIYDVRRIWTN